MLENKRGVIPFIVVIAIIVVLLIGTGSIIYLTSKDKNLPQEEGQEDEVPDEPNVPDNGDDGDDSRAPSGGGDGGGGGGGGGGGRGNGNPPPGQVCNNNGICEGGENENNCPNDCSVGGDFGGMNIIVILTDDQRGDTLDMEIDGRKIMPIVERELVQKGVKFTNAVVTTPLCCPFRASFLSGGYTSDDAFVRDNGLPNGGAALFDDTDTIATMVKEKGYATGLIGKYLNGYGLISPRVPPGWSSFVGVETANMRSWDNFNVVLGGEDYVTSQQGDGEIKEINQYITYYIRDETIGFIDKHAEEPFFLFVTPLAPHEPALTPPCDSDPCDETLFDQEKVNEYIMGLPSYREPDISDKPSWLKRRCENGPNGQCEDPAQLEFARKQMQSLQAVDRMVEEIINELEAKEILDKTIIIFASDNGYSWGEHHLSAKGNPYEESIRVPLVIRAPGIARGVRNEVVAVNLDLAAFTNSVTGVDKYTEGLDLTPLLNGNSNDWREGVFIQEWELEKIGDKNEMPDWAVWRTEGQKYVSYEDGEEEYYDLTSDIYEERSEHSNPNIAAIKQQMKANVDANLGLSIKTDRKLPDGFIGQSYNIQVEPWGGESPYTWSLFEGNLPKGLTLKSSGEISGIIDQSEFPGTNKFSIVVEDSSISPYTGEYSKYIQKISIDVKR